MTTETKKISDTDVVGYEVGGAWMCLTCFPRIPDCLPDGVDFIPVTRAEMVKEMAGADETLGCDNCDWDMWGPGYAEKPAGCRESRYPNQLIG
jgi:hypothetical protein